jgi:hypothetical protein
MISFLIWVLVLLVVMYVAKMVVDALELPANIRKVAMLILGLICLVALFNKFGYMLG